MTLSVELLLSFRIYATENMLERFLSLSLSHSAHEYEQKDNGEFPLTFPGISRISVARHEIGATTMIGLDWFTFKLQISLRLFSNSICFLAIVSSRNNRK